jgi:hypothetical protein
MGPGPSDTHPRVLQALAKNTVGHLDPYYLQIMNGLQEMLRGLFKTKNPMTMAISGTGSAGMEATVVNLIEPGDSMVVCVTGVFGGRMADVAERAGAKVTKVEKPWGEVYSPDDLKAALATKPKVVGIVMAETSTGAWQQIPEISKAVHDAGAMLLVDTVTAPAGAGRGRCLEHRRHLQRHAKMSVVPARLVSRLIQPAGDGDDPQPQDEGAKLVSRRVDAGELLGPEPRVSPHRPDQHDVRPLRGPAAGA